MATIAAAIITGLILAGALPADGNWLVADFALILSVAVRQMTGRLLSRR